MTVNISELMENYRDDEYALFDPAADPAHIRALTLEKIALLGGYSHRRRHIGRALRIALIAAALAALLGATAYAIYQRDLADRVLEERENGLSAAYSAVGEAPSAPPTAAPAGAEQYALGTEGDQSQYSCLGKNREYEAQKAWHDAQAASDEPLDARDLLDYADPHRLNYGVAYGVLAEKLDTIAARYGLRLWQSSACYDTEAELLSALGLESFYPAAPDERHAYIAYDDGSFQISGASLALPDGQALGCNIIRAVRGTLSDFLVLGGDPAQAQFETYAAAGGTETDLALWPEGALLFADTENCHVTFWFYDGTDAGLTMDELRQAADSIDFAALDTVNAPVAAENVAADLEQDIRENPGLYPEASGKARQVYDELGDYSLDALLPEGWKYEGSSVGTAEDVAEHFERLEGQKTPGEADYYDMLTLSYSPEDSQAYATYQWVSLTYERYWAGPDRAVIRNGQAFQNRRVTSISFPVSYYGEEDLTLCTVGGFDGYCIQTDDYGGHVDSQGVYITWYDTTKELLFTLAAPADAFTTRQALDLAETFAASIRDTQN